VDDTNTILRTNLTKRNQLQDFPLRRYAVISPYVRPAFMIARKVPTEEMRFWHGILNMVTVEAEQRQPL
jgi:hypothetical protein